MLVKFGLLFMRSRKLRSLYQENEKLDLHKTFIFSGFKTFLRPLQLDKSLFQKIYLYKLNLVPRGTGLTDVNYIKLCNTNLSNLMYSLLYTTYFTICNLEEYKLLLTIIILYCVFYYYMYFAILFGTC